MSETPDVSAGDEPVIPIEPAVDAVAVEEQGSPQASRSAGGLLRIAAVIVVVLIGLAIAYVLFGNKEPDRSADLKKLTPAESHARMLIILKAIADDSEAKNPYLGSRECDEIARNLQALTPADSVARRCELEFFLGDALARRGDIPAAIEHLSRAHELMPQSGLRPDIADYVTFKLGAAWLRHGETENCCALNHPDSCIVPIQPGGVHTKTEGSTKAIHYFELLLRSKSDAPHQVEASAPNSSTSVNLKHAARWLLNLAHMTLGGYPDKVSPELLIPVATFRSKVDFPKFTNVAKALGVDNFSLCGGAIVDDFDNDGYLDVIASTWDPRGQLRYFHNDRNGKFTDRTAAAGLTGLFGGLNLNQADFDNDGNLDFYVMRGAWLGVLGLHPNSLVRNNGDGTFTDVTFRAGLGDVNYPSQTSAWADYDNDGDLDLFVGNEFSGPKAVPAPCQLFRNEGDGTFVDVAASAGVQNLGFTKGVTWGDPDFNGWMDIYVSNFMGPNRFYRNNQNGTFTDIAAPLKIDGPRASFPTWFWDFDNDGKQDLFVATYTGRVDELAAWYVGEKIEFELPGLYRNVGDAGFVNVAKERGLALPMLTMGANFGDLNSDGYPDFYLGTGDPDYHTLVPNLMFLNQSGEGFVDITMASGFGHLQKGHAISFADIDNDGDLDVFQQMGGAYGADRFGDALFENPGFGSAWITIKLVGQTSNRSAIGARIRVLIEEDGKTRSVYRHVNSGGSFGGNPLRQTIPLGKATSIRSVEIAWPVTARLQTFTGLELNRTVLIVEDSKQARYLDVKRIKLGG